MEVSIGQRAARLYADVQGIFRPYKGLIFRRIAGPRPAAVATCVLSMFRSLEVKVLYPT